jgi:hypothetical protein
MSIRQEENPSKFVDRVISPSIGSVVNYHKSKTEYYPVYIIEGFYLDPVYQRLSNHWKWRKINNDGTLGDKEADYGLFSAIDKECDIETKIIFKENKS